jgi:hypothetical protein
LEDIVPFLPEASGLFKLDQVVLQDCSFRNPGGKLHQSRIVDAMTATNPQTPPQFVLEQEIADQR